MLVWILGILCILGVPLAVVVVAASMLFSKQSKIEEESPVVALGHK